MRRREFITLLGGAAAWPFVTRAQALHEQGLVEGRDLEITWGKADIEPTSSKELRPTP